ncbi:pseudoazurin [Roseobacter denitrificans]|uniref:Pseudoazurin n=1 Tax=Roseobacter denitrificans (strain ATCC 33942 / OCh 114) TaxID=375451 RepID=Q165X3_ROSDO|nr:pseudoazurin [Roseobacter denitrificans]ABG32220.1 pseudoazurin [Roseobacter denitrificans OCh 114]AVL51716.1 pseudoazurin [Roseobacter denitrificans]SFF78883.1 pseudoazurin [Roseobacter denitrificans OCh 114]
MLTRREFTLSLAALAGTQAIARPLTPAEKNARHSVLMLNAACGDAQRLNLFEPAILRVNAGDTVTFLATDSGHNTASKRGMIPQGATPWNGGIDEEISVTLSIPGIYGYICLPHYEMGMVGLIIAGDNLTNLAAASKLRHPGQAHAAFRALLKTLEPHKA